MSVTYKVAGSVTVEISDNIISIETAGSSRSSDSYISKKMVSDLLDSLVEGIGMIIDDINTDIVSLPGQILVAKNGDTSYIIFYNGFGTYITKKMGKMGLGYAKEIPKSDYLMVLKSVMVFIKALLV